MTNPAFKMIRLWLLLLFADLALSQNSGTSEDNNMVRFMGNGAYIFYNLTAWGQKHQSMLLEAQIENFSFKFITSERDGLIWIDDRSTEQLYIGLVDGDLVFVFDDHVRPASISRLHTSTDVTDFTWHSFEIKRSNRNLRFFVDERMITEVNMHKEIQFITSSNIYLGGAPNMTSLTGGRITSSFNGALYLAVYVKTVSTKLIKVSLFHYINTGGDKHGDITVLKYGQNLTGTHSTTSSDPVYIIDVIALRSTSVHIPGWLDLRRGGSFGFRFRTFDSDAIILFSERLMSRQFLIFISLELVDGRLYFVYNLDVSVKRVEIPGTNLGNGNWHDVRFDFRPGSVVVHLDQQDKTVQFLSSEQSQLLFNRGLYIAGLPPQRDFPGFLWSKRGYNGCFSNLKIDANTTSIRESVPVSDQPGLSTTCQLSSHCTVSSCSHGTCREGMDRFVCDCEGSGYQGITCGNVAPIGRFRGDTYVTYSYNSPYVSGINDFSLRFNTMMPNTFLFQTEANKRTEYIRGEIKEGSLKITVFAAGKTKEFYTGSALNDLKWHTMFLRRRGRMIELWVDNQRHVTGYLDSDYPSFTIDKVNIGNYRRIQSVPGFLPYSGYMQSVNIGGVYVFDVLRSQSDVTIDWFTNVTSSSILNFPVFNPITVLSQDAYLRIALPVSAQRFHVVLKLRTDRSTGVVMVCEDSTGMLLYIEIVLGHVLAGFLGNNRKYSRRIAQLVDNSQWHTIEVREQERAVGQSKYSIRVDNVINNMSTFNTPAFNVTQMYLGGVPVSMIKGSSAIGTAIHSKIGFVGCLSSVYVNSQTPDLRRHTSNPAILTGTCSRTSGLTGQPRPTPEAVIRYTVQFPGIGGYVLYRLSNLARQYPDIIQQTPNNETFAVRFRTQRQDGLIWMERRAGQTLYLALRGGHLVFGIDSDTGSPQMLKIPSQHNLGDSAWHDFKLVRVGRHLKFYIDNKLTKETEYQSTLQLASTGDVYVGGSPETSLYTRGQVTTDFGGQLTGVEYRKGASNTLMNLISETETLGAKHGRVTVYNNPDVTLGPSVPTTPTPPGQTVTLLDQATFRSSAWKIGNYIDLTTDGMVQFAFRTFDRRGLIWFAERLGSQIFLGVELFDGKVYLLFNFGQGDIRRRQISTGTVSNGQTNLVRLTVVNNVLTASVGRNIVHERLDPVTQNQRNFNGGQFISGLPSYPPYIWSGEGFNGCLMQLIITATATDLPGIKTLPTDDPSISPGCVSSDPCSRNPCKRGTCYSSLDVFECDCTATGYTGQTCSELAVVGGFTGSSAAVYRKQDPQKSYINDIAVRFKTMFPRAILFQTYSNSTEDYIKGELVDGSVKVTVYKDGVTDTHSTGSHLNDNMWHNLYIQRRDERLEIWVDQRPHISGTLRGDDFYIDISGIHLGSGTGSGTGINVDGQLPPFIGYMQNVYFDDIDIISRLHAIPNVGIAWYNSTPTDGYDPLIYDPVTLSSRATYLELGTLPVSTALHIKFKFRTGQADGLLLFNEGRNGEFIAMEVVQGKAFFVCNTGLNNTVSLQLKSVNENQWHSIEVKGTTRNNQRFYQVRLDEIEHLVPIRAELEPTRPLFLGGLPRDMYITNSIVKKSLRSDNGYMGCIASVYLNSGRPNLDTYSKDNSVILGSCKDITGFCPPVDPCQHGGTCRVGVNRYQCDCEETGYSGPHCGLHPIGIYFGEREQPGVISYTLKQDVTSSQDSLVFGFMTKRADGTLVRLESSSGREYIVIRMEGGNVVAHYDTGSGVKTLTLADKRLNDGKYHVVHFYRDELGARLQVDGVVTTIDGSQSSFDRLKYVFLGGRPSSDGGVNNAFYGLLGGFYYNRMGLIDQYLANTAGFTVTGDTSFVQDHHYELVPPGGRYDGYIHISPDIGGGGVAGRSYGGSKEINIGDGTNPGTDGGGALLPESLPAVASAFTAPNLIPMRATETGPRAGALIGTILGTLAFAASMLWALWQCKPGILPCCGNGGYLDLAKFGFDGGNVASGGSGAGGGTGGTSSSAKVSGDVISGGAVTGNTSQLQVSSLSMAKSISGCDEDNGCAASSGGAKVTIGNSEANQNAGGSAFAYYSTTGNSNAASSGGQSLQTSSANQSIENSTVNSSKVFYSSTSGVTLVNDRYQEVSNFNEESNWDSSTMRSTTCLIDSGTMQSSTSLVDAGGSSSYSHSASATNINLTTIGGSGGTFLGNSAEAHGESTTADYDFPMGYNETCSNYTTSNTLKQEGFSSSTSYKNQVEVGGQFGQMSYSPLAVTPGAAGEEVRVDCCFVTDDGSSVVTGSSSGPPQVWNMQTGELLRIMKGDTVGSSSLNLACYDSLLVGTVQADLDVNAFSIGKGVTHKKLQVWNFVTGRPLEMGPSDTCSAICLTDDKESVVFAKSDKFGNGTTITLWDLMGNQIVKQVRYDAPVGNNDYVNFLSLSSHDKYCVAGFTNTFDNQIEFLTFDMSTATGVIQNPNIIKLDAFSECTVLLPRDEAVTGLRDGSLVVWSLRTGQTRRNLLAGSESHGHASAVTDLAHSVDKKFLISASADKTLKIWNMDREQLTRTLTGHADEVWCTAVSQDGEIVVSGSRDGSIRLWRLEDGSEICAFATGIDVFYVTMSHDRGTIVALGDKYSARKLIMLQVVHTKIRKEIVS
ncbi:uncharacterized protein LOC110460116 [Mizuhopecten yessoensis]|uniref:Neurexin-1a n=1 Tax=Mizuhopecten yessoensis TaxID=6573 RepID=A0A210Q2Z8_MIZYE|nr:uncharacterized protein LOC110460116 [Mizuhopecten yessoensis]OWF43128.1 Neurexin-1a [Mizuhopecten yessoensis]